MKFALAFAVFLVCAAAIDCSGPGSEIYDKGSAYGYYYWMKESCPLGDGSGGVYISLFTPPELPWNYSSICMLMMIRNSSAPLGATTSIPITVLAYGASIDPLSGNHTVSSMTPLLSRLAGNATVHSSAFGYAWNSLPLNFAVYSPNVFLGFQYKQRCGSNTWQVVLLGSNSAAYPWHLGYAKLNSSSFFQQWQDFNWGSIAIRAQGNTFTAPEVIPGWTCNRSWYKDRTECHCGCGLTDPDCLNSTISRHSPSTCGWGGLCLTNNTCFSTGWSTSCDPGKYGSDGVCQCGCGGLKDPDCNGANPIVCPFDSGVVPVCNNATNTCSDAWTCSNKTAYHDGHKCNCGCGVPDPDCVNASLPDDCSNNFRCVGAVCAYPKTWTCGIVTYNTGIQCDCECGAYDPDCTNLALPLTCSGTAEYYTCTVAGHCIEAKCGNNYTDAIIAETCDGGTGCGSNCKCTSGYSAIIGSVNCAPICGDGVKKPQEECDSIPLCDPAACRCSAGHPYDTSRGVCSGCGNGVIEGAEQCDGGSGCLTNCSCDFNYVSTSPVTKDCALDTNSGKLPQSTIVIIAASVGGGGLLLLTVAAVIIAAICVKRRKAGEPPVVLVSMNPDGTLSASSPMVFSGVNPPIGSPPVSAALHSTMATGVIPPPMSGPIVPPPDGSEGQEYLYDRFGNPVGVLQ